MSGFFGRDRKKKITAAQFDKEVESLVQFVQQNVSPFETDSAEKQSARVRAARDDQDFFNQTYLPHYFSQPGADFHREMEEMIAEGEEQHRPVGIAAPRGHAKSTRITFAHALRKALLQEKHFILEISDTELQASGFTASMRVEAEHNKRLLRDFGQLKTKEWGAGEFVLRTGCKILARGDGQGIRGLKHGPHRPDLAIIDDIENDQSVKNPNRVKATHEWIMEAVYPSLDPEHGVLFMVGTLLSRRSVLAKVLENTEFISRIFRAITNPEWSETAREFIKGFSLWPERFSLAALSRIRRIIGSLSFNKEYQNDPSDEGAMFREQWIKRMPVETIPVNIPLYMYGAIDPSLRSGESHDYKANITVARMGAQYLVRHAWIRHATIPAMIAQAYAGYERFHHLQIGLETETWQELLLQNFAAEAEKRKLHLPIRPMVNHGLSKDDEARIGHLSPLHENGHLIFAQGPEDEVGDMGVLIEQLLAFPSTTVNDDGPDALEKAVRLAELRTLGKPSFESVGKRHLRFAEGAY
ncbi:MAG: hypothetical protein AB7P69_03685 [Candidatus Binatia bacterium]